MRLWGWAAIGGAVAVLGMAQAGFVAYQQSWHERILPNVSIQGQPVGGLSLAEARARASSATSSLTRRTVTVQFEEQSWTADAADLGFGYDVDSALTNAFAIGHGGVPWTGLATQLTLLRQPDDISLLLTADSSRLGAWTDGVAGEINRPLRDASLTVSGGAVSIDPGQDGRSVDLAGFQQAVRDWAASGNASAQLTVPVNVQPRSRTGEQLGPAANGLRLALGEQPLHLTLDTQSWDVPAATVRGAMSWQLDGVQLKLSLDPVKLKPQLDPVAKAVNQPAQDAEVGWGDQGLTIQKPSKDGRELDVDATLAAAAKALQAPDHRAPVVVKTSPAKVSSADLPALGIKELVAEGKSNFSYSPWERVVNVKKMAGLLNGVLIAPGEEFSFNKVMGDIGPGEGWAEGLVISGGRTVPGLGGGICQVSTTTFRGAFWAGLPITERHDHDYPVPYYTQGGYEEGFDATVWSPDLDLKFRNDTPGYLLIQTTIDTARSNLTVSFYGTKVPGRQVTMVDPVVSNVRPAPAPRHIVDPGKPVGYVNQTDFPHPGMHVVLGRVVQDGNGTRTDQFVSDYTPWSAVYVEGPQPQQPPADEDAPPDA